MTTITLATTDHQRAQAQRLLEQVIPGIAPNAVPQTNIDNIYRPLVALAHDSHGVLVGAALTCRPQRAVAVAMMLPLLSPTARGTQSHPDAVSELDLLGVLPAARGHGIGSTLIEFLEPALKAQGTRYWIGNVTKDMDDTRLRAFYTRHGFRCQPNGLPLPLLGGQDWETPSDEPPAFRFWKRVQ